MTEPAYFDSQAQAAAALNLDVEVIRQAKREGCRAFRSGRVYHGELAEWLREKQISRRPECLETGSRSRDDSATELPSLGRCAWRDRRAVLFEMLEFMDGCHRRGELTAKQCASISERLMPLLCKIADVLEIPQDELDRAAWQRMWREWRKGLHG